MENRYFTELVRQLRNSRDLPDRELTELLTTDAADRILAGHADEVRRSIYGTAVYTRGLIEFTNYCKNNCYYCGIRGANTSLKRYRLTEDDILSCCEQGYALGFRTFVLQGGEDPYFSEERLAAIVRDIRRNWPDCAITLSVGERSRETYQTWFEAGANRYLLRHETADATHYRQLHPASMSLENRKRCLFDLKEIGYQTGSGFMVGSPYQKTEHLIADLRFLQQLQPEMIGIGPYLTHLQTPLRDFPDGNYALTLRLISILRLMFPYALIPATTALGTIRPDGREQGLKAGANVVMPNLSPTEVRELYLLYENKICVEEESSQCRSCLEMRTFGAGYELVSDIGNAKREPEPGATASPLPEMAENMKTIHETAEGEL